jgi:hypothetical protein
MEHKNKTALEWFLSKLPLGVRGSMHEEIHIALGMEMNQMEDVWDTAHQAGRFEGKGIAKDNWMTFSNYIDETFNDIEL